MKANWAEIAKQPRASQLDDGIAWMQTDAYLETARVSMERYVVGPLRARSIPIASWP